MRLTENKNKWKNNKDWWNKNWNDEKGIKFREIKKLKTVRKRTNEGNEGKGYRHSIRSWILKRRLHRLPLLISYRSSSSSSFFYTASLLLDLGVNFRLPMFSMADIRSVLVKKIHIWYNVKNLHSQCFLEIERQKYER